MKKIDEEKKLRKLERLTKDLSPEGWRLLSAQMDTYSEDFMRKYADKIDWSFISIGNRLTEDFIREMKDYVDWGKLSTWKKMSEDFMREFKDKLNWNTVSRYRKFSFKFIKEFDQKINFGLLTINENFKREDWLKCKEKGYFYE